MQKFHILIEKLENPKEKKLICDNKAKIEDYVRELPAIFEKIFKEEKELSLSFMNITINE